MKSTYWIIIVLAVACIVLAMKNAYIKNDASSGSVADEANNAAYENIMTRSSVRNYNGTAVPDSVIEKILKAGMAAPTAANAQPWGLVVITDQTLKDAISDAFIYAKAVKESGFAVIVCGNMNHLFTKDGDSRESGFWIQDCSAVSENILLASHALGLGGVWCGIYPVKERVEKLREIVALPDSLEPLNVIAIGYPAAPASPKDKWDPAKVHYNKF